MIKLITKILQITVLISVTLLVICWYFVGTFKSNQQLTALLDDAEFYPFAAKIISEQINSQLVGDEKSVSATKLAIEQSISSQLAKTTLQPMQIAIIEWLSNEEEKFSLEIDLTAIKNKATNATSEPELKFLLTKLLPDNLNISSAEKINEQDTKSLGQFKSFYQFSEKAIPILALFIVSLFVILLILNFRRGSKKITSILMPLAGASIVGLVLIGLSYPLQDMIQISTSQSQTEIGVNVTLKLLLAVLQLTLWSWVMIGLFSISGIIISRLNYRTKDKKIKENIKK